MTTYDDARMSVPHPALRAQAGTRDIRLDFFRGIAMFIILIAHIPDNWATLWIPARFGFSDATEMFVFCSGMASAIAFGGTFVRMGWAVGAARVAYRVWQVYWAHIGMFLAIATMLALLDSSGAFRIDYTRELNLDPFFNRAALNLPGLMTLTYVPNYFDILPMYMVILAMMPVVVALAGVARGLAAAFVVALWLAANLQWTGLPAEPWSNRAWFFDPFGWQLLFFTGFAFMRGWLPAPPVTPLLLALAGAVVILSVPFSYFRILNGSADLREIRAAIDPLVWKTDFGLLRYVHFLSLAYIAWAFAGPGGARLLAAGEGVAGQIWNRIVAVLLKVGQQSLIVFVFSMVLARALGVVLDVTGSSLATMLAVNLGGAALVVGVAYGGGWIKSQPWKKRA